MNRTASDEPLRAEAADRSIGPMGRYAWALVTAVAVAADQAGKAAAFDYVAEHGVIDVTPFLTIRTGMNPGIAFGLATQRSDEHTSDLQSLTPRSYADFCLKKKK